MLPHEINHVATTRWLHIPGKLFFYRILVTSLLVLRLSEAQASPTANTDKGRVRGFTIDVNGKKVDAFYGIPYAAPPIGDLRFKPPVQIDPWTHELDATRLPNSCYQTFDSHFGNFTGSTMWNANTPLSEDCLYLNVWVPKSSGDPNKAVIVWVYGGGFYSGTSTLDIYMAQTLAAENDVVVVSMQYRVGSLGFLALDTSEAPGNAGLWDQRMALEWVSRNIHNFEGNSHNVTLMGESAGAVSVGLFLICDVCRGFFHRAILQSGAPQAEWGVLSKEQMWDRSSLLSRLVGCPTDAGHTETVKCLRKINASEFPHKDMFLVQGVVQFPFVPVVDGVFIPQAPREMLRSGTFKKIPLLLGSNSNEGTFFIVYFSRKEAIEIKDLAFVEETFRWKMHEEMFKFYPTFPTNLNEFGKSAIMFQYRNWLRPSDGSEMRRSVDKAVSDYYFVCKVNELARAYVREDQPVYYYWFDHRWSANPWPEWMGVLHADEIWFTFGHPLNASHSFTVQERLLSRKMMTYWTNFAKTGDPNRGPGQASMGEWPRYNDGQKYLNISVDSMRHGNNWGSHPRTRACAFWEEYLPKLVAETSNISEAEREWKLEFHTWKTRYIVDWKTQFESFLRIYQERMGTCGGGRP